MANIPVPNRINVPAWKALMRKFHGDPDAADQFTEALASELNQLATHADLKALELRLVRWMIAISVLTIGALTAIDRFT